MTIDYAKLTEQYFKAAGSPVDLRAATLGATTATSDLDKAAASVNFIKACEAVVSLVRHVPNPVGAAIITTSFTVNLLQAVADREAYGYVRPTTRLALIGELYGIGSTLGFAVAIAGGTVVGLSAPLLVAVSGVLATAAIAATFVAASQESRVRSPASHFLKFSSR